MKVMVAGIDLGKDSCSLVGLDHTGRVVLRRRLRRDNVERFVGDTTAVGSYPQGESPFGLYDIVGNVYEWILDWYGAEYYSNAPNQSPRGPQTGSTRVIRGGSMDYRETWATTVFRDYIKPSNSTDQIGFRCVVEINP